MQVHGPGGSRTLGGVTALDSGDFHVLALKSDGTVWSWSFDGFGQLGYGAPASCDGDPCGMTPAQVTSLSSTVLVGAGSRQQIITYSYDKLHPLTGVAPP